MIFAGKWMDLELIMLSEISQNEKDKYHIFSHMQTLDLHLYVCACTCVQIMKVGWGQSERGRDFKDEERPWDTHNVKAENRHQRLVSVKGKGNEYKQSMMMCM